MFFFKFYGHFAWAILVSGSVFFLMNVCHVCFVHLPVVNLNMVIVMLYYSLFFVGGQHQRCSNSLK